jgi:hypothetical protein
VRLGKDINRTVAPGSSLAAVEGQRSYGAKPASVGRKRKDITFEIRRVSEVGPGEQEGMDGRSAVSIHTNDLYNRMS